MTGPIISILGRLVAEVAVQVVVQRAYPVVNKTIDRLWEATPFSKDKTMGFHAGKGKRTKRKKK